MDLTKRIEFLNRAYQLFNERDIDGLFAMMTDDIQWPDVATGTVLHGKHAIRPYWEGQFAVADPRVNPRDFTHAGEDIVGIIDQQIFDLQGRPLTPPAVVYHRYTFEGDLVSRMVVFEDREKATA
jgi:ketosteroid isomerase-like protein